jgi:N-methylhydantoinase A
MLQTQIRHDISRSFYRALESPNTAVELGRLVSQISDEGMQALAVEGIESHRAELHTFADMRYVGQEYTVAIQLDSDVSTHPGFARVVADQFHRAHETRYGHANPDAAVEFVMIRLAALGDLGRVPLKPSSRLNRPDHPGAPHATRKVAFNRVFHPTPVFMRDELPAGTELVGPAIVEEATATTTVPPGWRLRVDDFGSLELQMLAGATV